MDTLKSLFQEYQGQTNPWPLSIEIERADGLYIYATNGKRYTDFISGVSVSNIGHCHPAIVEAVTNQVHKYMHVMVYGEYIQEPQALLAKKLNDILPENLNNSYFVNSGTEANEAALKLAKRVTGRSEIISFRGAYHGSTHGSLSVSGNESRKRSFRPLLPDVRFIDFNIINDLQYITSKTAAVIVEPIQGDAGVRIPTVHYMKALREQCTKVGAQLIFDEIQTGFGRTGKLFAFEHFNVIPDILTIAKGFGGGMPIGAFISSKEKMQSLTDNPILGHITTFGGHPVNCAAALANLEILTNQNWIEESNQKGKLIEELLQHKKVKEIRRKGLFFAIDMDSAEEVQKVVEYCISKGVLTFWFLSCPWSFRIAPPLTVSNEEIEESCKIIIEAFNQI